ncbi:GNAT family N-acetyltransferase [Brachybacterium horti]
MNGAAPPSPDGEGRAVLRTPRLRLPLVTEQDLEELWRLHSDPAAFLHDSTAPLTAKGQMAWVLRQWVAHAESGGAAGYRRVLPAGGGDLLGIVGLAPLDSAAGPLLSAYWRLHPAAQGQGLATEALRAVLGMLRPGDPEVIAVTAARNAPSLALARRLGFHPGPPEREVPGGRAGDVLLVLDRPAARG